MAVLVKRQTTLANRTSKQTNLLILTTSCPISWDSFTINHFWYYFTKFYTTTLLNFNTKFNLKTLRQRLNSTHVCRFVIRVLIIMYFILDVKSVTCDMKSKACGYTYDEYFMYSNYEGKPVSLDCYIITICIIKIVSEDTSCFIFENELK